MRSILLVQNLFFSLILVLLNKGWIESPPFVSYVQKISQRSSLRSALNLSCAETSI